MSLQTPITITLPRFATPGDAFRLIEAINPQSLRLRILVCDVSDGVKSLLNERLPNAIIEDYSQNDIETIAHDVLGLETLETRKMYLLDFKEHAVWRIKDALEAAYRAGQASMR